MVLGKKEDQRSAKHGLFLMGERWAASVSGSPELFVLHCGSEEKWGLLKKRHLSPYLTRWLLLMRDGSEVLSRVRVQGLGASVEKEPE